MQFQRLWQDVDPLHCARAVKCCTVNRWHAISLSVSIHLDHIFWYIFFLLSSIFMPFNYTPYKFNVATDEMQACFMKIGSGTANKRINMLYGFVLSFCFFKLFGRMHFDSIWEPTLNLSDVSACVCLIEHYVNIEVS